MTVPGKGGRPRKPSNLRSVDGDKPDRFNDAEPVPGAGEVVPPGWLVELDAACPVGEQSALDVWCVRAPDLIAKGVLTAWDVEAFAVWCDAVVTYRRAARMVDDEGIVVTGEKGRIKNPAFQVARDSADTMVKIGARFGLTPSDRAGLKIEKENQGGGPERLLS